MTLLLTAIGGVALMVLVLALWAGVCWLIDAKFKPAVGQWEDVVNPRIVRKQRK